MVKRFALLLALCAAIGFAAAPAAAHGHGGHGGHGGHHGHHHGGGHAHFHSFIIGAAPLYPPRPFYDPYYPYGVAYPADLIIVTTPLYAAPAPGECRAFQGDAVFAGTVQPFYGTACLQADGAWHVLH